MKIELFDPLCQTKNIFMPMKTSPSPNFPPLCYENKQKHLPTLELITPLSWS
jgi:hypothetical protein